MDYAKSPISGIYHRIVRDSDREAVDALAEWVARMEERLANEQPFTIAFDCEGTTALGEEEHTLLLLQFAELWDETVDPYKKGFSGGLKVNPGFVIVFPTSDDVVGLLSRAFGHERVALISFDFTGDVAVLEEEGVRVSLQRMFDTQLLYAEPGIQNTRTIGMRKLVQKMSVGSDPLVAPAQQLEEPRVWEVNRFVGEFDGLSGTDFLTRELLIHAVADIDLTGLLCLEMLRQDAATTVADRSQTKAAEFRDVQQRYGYVLAPSLLRRAAFFQRFGESQITDMPTAVGSTEEINRVLIVWDLAREALCIQEHPHLKKPIKCTNLSGEYLRERLDGARAMLVQVLDRVREMATIGARR